MSILIKGVSLDDFKPICPCMNGEYGNCDVPWVKRCYGIGKDGCPLVEIPPHGRLIDADAYKREMKDCRMAFWDEVLDSMPVVIPAEEGET